MTEMTVSDPTVNQDLAQATANHLRFLRAWALQAPAHVVKVAGVNILACLNYDLIQLVNNVFLSAYIESQMPETSAEEEEVA